MINMKVCSWDVGIKNLAYCVMEKNDNDSKIIKWDVINLVDSDKITCCALLKNNKICGKKASYFGNLEDIKYYCGTHKHLYKPLEDGWENNYMVKYDSNADQCSFIFPKKNVRCTKRSIYRNDDNTYCNAHKQILVDKRKKKAQIKLIPRKKVTSTNMQILSNNMYTKLDAIKELLDVDIVLIENQPSLKNPTMKTISSLLFGYFTMRGIMDENKDISEVKFISPSNKLKIEITNIQKILNNINDDTKIYKIIDTLSRKYINNLNELVDKSYKNNFVHLVLTYLMNKKETLNGLKDNDIFTQIKLNYNEFIELIKEIEKDTKNYELTKLLAIEYTKILLESDNEWYAHLDTYKKKDDVCDAFLQGKYYLFND